MQQKQDQKILERSGVLHFMNFTTIHDELPVGNWTLKATPVTGELYLERSRDFTYPAKVYGDVQEHVKFYTEAYKSSEKNLGIVLNGEKGSGKTLLATLICRELNLPVILITSRFGGAAFTKFMDDINQPVIVLIDEFDKIYSRDYEDPETGQIMNSQTDLLRIMDAGNSSKKFFILTSNKNALSEYMTNRPSRIRYHQSFEKLTEPVIVSVLEDRLKDDNKKFIEDFVQVANVYGGFNLDTLLILVDEVNRYNDSPKRLIARMNIIPEDVEYKVTLEEGGKSFESQNWTEDFDLINQEFITMNFKEAQDDYNKPTKWVKNIRQERVSNFDISTNRKGITMRHKTQNYTIVFKRYIPVQYKNVDF